MSINVLECIKENQGLIHSEFVKDKIENSLEEFDRIFSLELSHPVLSRHFLTILGTWTNNLFFGRIYKTLVKARPNI